MSVRGQLDPATRAYLDRATASSDKPIGEMAVEEARAFMQAGQSVRYGHPALTAESIAIAGVPSRIVRPRTADKPLSAEVYLHGGGWVLGSPDTHAGIVQELALRTGAAFVVPEYALAPEHPFPHAFEQCCAVAEAICSGSGPDSFDSSRVALAGDSAGGNLAAAVALHAAGKDGMRFRLQALICPVFDPDCQTRSYAEFAEGFGLTAEAMRWFWSHYLGGAAADERVTPLHSAMESLKGIAPAFVLTAGCDVLRDEAEQYARLLWDAGAQATVLRFPGTIHNFPVIDELRGSPAGQAAIVAIADALSRALAIASTESDGLAPQRTNQE